MNIVTRKPLPLAPFLNIVKPYTAGVWATIAGSLLATMVGLALVMRASLGSSLAVSRGVSNAYKIILGQGKESGLKVNRIIKDIEQFLYLCSFGEEVKTSRKSVLH